MPDSGHRAPLRIAPRGVLVATVLGLVTVVLVALGVHALTVGRKVSTLAPVPPATLPATTATFTPNAAPAAVTPSPTLSPTPRAAPTAEPTPRPTPTPTPAAVSPGPATGAPYAVSHDSITLTDPTRATPARGTIPAHDGRDMLTVIRRPLGLAGPLPVVVFGHGWNSNPTVYEPLLDEWAAAGYLVAAPTFPSSANTLPGPAINDYPEQARDLSFVLTALLAGRAGPVDPGRIAVAGHSDGGTDIAYLALNPAYTDRRVRAYLSLSSEIPDGAPGPWGAPIPGALLVAVGTSDEYGLAARSRHVFNVASVSAKAMLTVTGGNHIGIYIGASPQAVALRHETARFLNAALQPGGTSSSRLAAALSPTGDPSILLTPGTPG